MERAVFEQRFEPEATTGADGIPYPQRGRMGEVYGAKDKAAVAPSPLYSAFISSCSHTGMAEWPAENGVYSLTGHAGSP